MTREFFGHPKEILSQDGLLKDVPVFLGPPLYSLLDLKAVQNVMKGARGYNAVLYVCTWRIGLVINAEVPLEIILCSSP